MASAMATAPQSMENAGQQRVRKPSRFLTPLQLVEYVPHGQSAIMQRLTLDRLKKGPRANIIIGPDGDCFIGIEGVAVNLLAHFSPYAKQVLIDERATTLCIPDGAKVPLRLIYKYMQAGETNPKGEMAFEELFVDCLISLYSHSTTLYYQHLMDRVV